MSTYFVLIGSHVSYWIYYYLCNQCLSPLMLWVRIPLRWGVLDTTLCDKVCQWLTTGRLFSPGTLLSSTNKIDLHDITEILLKVALNTINQTKTIYAGMMCVRSSTKILHSVLIQHKTCPPWAILIYLIGWNFKIFSYKTTNTNDLLVVTYNKIFTIWFNLAKKHGHHWQFLFLNARNLKIFSSETVSPNDLLISRNNACEVFYTNSSFSSTCFKNKAVIGNSRFWLAQVLKIFSPETKSSIYLLVGTKKSM